MKNKNLLVLALIIVVLLTSLTGLFAEYNRSEVIQVMRNNVMLLGQLKTATKNKNYFDAAVALMELAKGSHKIMDFTPRKGSQAKWKEIHEKLITAAFKGIGAAGEHDIDGLNAAINTILALNREGHGLFR